MQNQPLSVSASSSLQPAKNINPITFNIDELPRLLLGLHDSQAKRFEVRSLFKALVNVIQNSPHIGHFVDQRRPKAVEIVEDSEPQLQVMPSFRVLKQIACEMTCCKLLDESAAPEALAHNVVLGILAKLRNKTWDAKAVITLAAFALDYGENWRLSLVEDRKTDLLELHVFKIAGVEKAGFEPIDDYNTLVVPAMKLIEGIIDMEQIISAKTYLLGDATLETYKKDNRDIYTYWAIMGLLVASSGAYEWDQNFKSNVTKKLPAIYSMLLAELEFLRGKEEDGRDYAWRQEVFRKPSGLRDLLIAVIFPRNVVDLDIFEGHTGVRVPLEELKTKTLLLFFSGLDGIEDEISLLNPIHEAFKRDKDKQNYGILWIPVVDKWSDAEITKYENLRKNMRWYVVRYFSLIKGSKLVRTEWKYADKPIIVVVNPQGDVIHPNAKHMIFVWGIQAFPFTPELERKLSDNNKWFWNEVKKVHPSIAGWTAKDTHIFIYGGTDPLAIQSFGSMLEGIKKDPIVLNSADALIEHFDLGNADPALASTFWNKISHSLQSKITRSDSYELDPTFDPLTLISMQNEKCWALVSKGENVLVLEYDPIISNVLKEFASWREDVRKSNSFAVPFMNYYNFRWPQFPRHCNQVSLSHIGSRIPLNLPCPDPRCNLRMETELVKFRCCHGIKNENVINII